MSGKVRRVDYYPDEYVTGVGGVLRADEQGVYWMVCTLVMSEGGPIDFNERRLGALCMMRPSDIRRVVYRLVSAGKLSLSEGKLSQKRAQSEVEKASNRIQTASESGAKGGRPRKIVEQNQQNEKAKAFSDEKLTTNYQPPTNNQEAEDVRPKPTRRRHSYSPAFDEFWQGYPTDSLMSKAEAGKAFDKLDEGEQAQVIRSLPAFRAYCSQHPDYRPVHANRYITQRRFEGFIKTVEATADRVFVAMGSDVWKALLHNRGVVSMAHTEHEGRRGWWFTRKEVAAAQQTGAPVDWAQAGSA